MLGMHSERTSRRRVSRDNWTESGPAPVLGVVARALSASLEPLVWLYVSRHSYRLSLYREIEHWARLECKWVAWQMQVARQVWHQLWWQAKHQYNWVTSATCIAYRTNALKYSKHYYRDSYWPRYWTTVEQPNHWTSRSGCVPFYLSRTPWRQLLVSVSAIIGTIEIWQHDSHKTNYFKGAVTFTSTSA